MSHSLRHRMLRALVALSLVISTAPASLAAISAEDHARDCSFLDGRSTAVASEPGGASPVHFEVTQAGRDDLPPGPGPCPTPFTTCTAAGVCLSMAPLPTSPSPALPSDFVGVVAVDCVGSLLSPASRILTPPPRS